MKQKDMALILIVAFVSAVASFFISNALFTSKNSQQQVQVVPSISASFQTPDSRYFNSSSIDPTQLIQIGNTTNTNPFNGTGTSQ
jgi:hypothetical protein